MCNRGSRANSPCYNVVFRSRLRHPRLPSNIKAFPCVCRPLPCKWAFGQFVSGGPVWILPLRLSMTTVRSALTGPMSML